MGTFLGFWNGRMNVLVADVGHVVEWDAHKNYCAGWFNKAEVAGVQADGAEQGADDGGDGEDGHETEVEVACEEDHYCER